MKKPAETRTSLTQLKRHLRTLASMLALAFAGAAAIAAAPAASLPSPAASPALPPAPPAKIVAFPDPFDDPDDVPMPDPDLWQRIRVGFALEPLETPLVRQHEDWY